MLILRAPGYSGRDRDLLALLRPHPYEAYLDAERHRHGPLSLTPRHWELLRLVAVGHTDAQIARRLGVTEGTVHIHLQNIYSRLPVFSRTTAVTRAFRDQAAGYTGRVIHQSDARQLPFRKAQVRAGSARHQETASPVSQTSHQQSTPMAPAGRPPRAVPAPRGG